MNGFNNLTRSKKTNKSTIQSCVGFFRAVVVGDELPVKNKKLAVENEKLLLFCRERKLPLSFPFLSPLFLPLHSIITIITGAR